MADARVIVGSLAAHAVVLAVLDAFVAGAPRAAGKRPPRVELVEPVAEIEVAIVEPTSTSSAPRQTAPARASVATTRAPSVVEVPSSSDTANETETSTSEGTSRWTRMRGPEGPVGPDLSVHEDVPHEALPAESAPTSDKKLQQDGTSYKVPDLVTTMHVTPDGRASFHDKPDIDIHLTLPSFDWKQTKKELGDHLAGWYRDPYAQKNARRYQDMPRHEQAVPGGWNAGAGGDTNIDGSIQQPDELERRTSGRVGAGGKLDITAWLMRKTGVGDPYASRKRGLLDGTQAERVQIRAKYNREQLDHSAVLMRDNVNRVFAELRDPAERRAALFALWDECAEGEGQAGEAGDRARAIVIGAIRARLSGADRFTDEETAALDARRTSVQHFVPY